MNKIRNVVLMMVAAYMFTALPGIAQVNAHPSLKAENLKIILVKDIENISDSAHHHHAHDPHKSNYKIVHVQFTLTSTNPTADKGYKSVMMRLIDPHGVDIYDPAAGGGLFNLNGKETPYTYNVSGKYDGKPMEMDFLYKNSKQFKHGLHIIELYVDGMKIGEEHFVIK
jgi:hypothetical protein